MADDKKLVGERVRNLDQLYDTYERLSKTASSSDVSLRERPPENPFGDGGPPKAVEPADRWSNAKQVAVRIVKFFVLASEEWQLGPEEMIYAAELVGVNILNARDIPLPPKKVAAIRALADKYYADSLPQVPDAKR